MNSRGYTIDEKGNVVDKRGGNKVFDKKLLIEGEEIPKVFRKGILRKDTGDSFSRIMSEIEELERRQDSEYENEYPVNGGKGQKKKDKKKKQRKEIKEGEEYKEDDEEEAGNTSIESMMEDTPSNYNVANQRFELNKEFSDVEGIEEDFNEEDNFDLNGARLPKLKLKKKFKKHKKPKVKKQDKHLNDKDMLMG